MRIFESSLNDRVTTCDGKMHRTINNEGTMLFSWHCCCDNEHEVGVYTIPTPKKGEYLGD